MEGGVLPVLWVHRYDNVHLEGLEVIEAGILHLLEHPDTFIAVQEEGEQLSDCLLLTVQATATVVVGGDHAAIARRLRLAAQDVHAAAHEALYHLLLVILSGHLVVKLEVEGDQQLLRYLLRLVVLGQERHLPQRIHADQLLELEHFQFAAAEIEELLVRVDHAEVLLEALDEGDRDLGGVHLVGVAQELLEQESLLLLSEDVDLIRVLGPLLSIRPSVQPLFVDPVKEDGLVTLKVRLLDEESPQALDIVNTHPHYLVLIVFWLSILLWLADQQLDQVKSLLDSFVMGVSAAEDMLLYLVGYGATIVVELLALLLHEAVVGLDVLH